MISKQNEDIKSREATSRRVEELAVDTSNETAERYKAIYDNFAKQQTGSKDKLITRRGELDAELNELRASSGGLFSSKKKKIEAMELAQAAERESIQSRIEVIDIAIDNEYTNFLAKVDQLAKPANKPIVVDSNGSDQIKANELEILDIQSNINDTDIGSFRYIATAFDISVDEAVKWFMFMIVFVFDPLAMSLVLGYNMYVVRRTRTKNRPRNLTEFKNLVRDTETVIPTQFEEPEEPEETPPAEEVDDGITKAKKVVYIRGKKQR